MAIRDQDRGAGLRTLSSLRCAIRAPRDGRSTSRRQSHSTRPSRPGRPRTSSPQRGPRCRCQAHSCSDRSCGRSPSRQALRGGGGSAMPRRTTARPAFAEPAAGALGPRCLSRNGRVIVHDRDRARRRAAHHVVGLDRLERLDGLPGQRSRPTRSPASSIGTHSSAVPWHHDPRWACRRAARRRSVRAKRSATHRRKYATVSPRALLCAHGP